MATIEKRTTNDGVTTYRVKIRLKGYPTETATFERKTDAKIWAQQTETAIRKGRYFKVAEARKHTLAELVERYIRDVLPTKPRSEKDQTRQLNWWKEQIGSYTLADVTPALIAEYRDKLANGITMRGTQRSPSTVNRYLAPLSHAYSVAVKEWGWLDDSPMRKVGGKKEPRGRVRFLSDDEVLSDGTRVEGERTRLLKACKESKNAYLYTVVVLALSTGMRQGEIMNLTWDDVDLNRGRVTLHETKNGERRVVPLVGHALELVEELSQERKQAKVRRIDTNLLFPGQNPQNPVVLRVPWLAALEKAGIEDFRFHDLRHSAASYLAMNGASLAEIAEVLGHKTLQMVKRYAHLSEAHTAGVVASMNDKIFG